MESQNFTWVPLYKELATALLKYKGNRTELVNWIYSDLGKVNSVSGNSLTNYLHMKDGSRIQDIDPFSVFAIFNRRITRDNRIDILQRIKSFMELSSEVPTDFDGIPIVDSRRAFFFSWDNDNHKVITDLWTLFENVVKGEDISSAFNKVIENGMPKNSLSICLFWISPENFLALDSKNRSFIKKYGLNGDFSVFNYSIYSVFLNQVTNKMKSGEIPFKSFKEISYSAWMSTSKTNNSPNNRQYWLAGYSYGGDNSQLDRFIKERFWDCGYDENKPVDQKQLAETKTISVSDIIILKSSSTKGPNHDKPFLRVKAVGVVTSDISVTDKGEGKKECRCSVDYINTDEKDFDGSVYGHYRKTIHRADSKVKEVIDYVNELLNKDAMPQKKYQKYIDLLKETHNLVLTGAPGTGKTFMAQKIAEEMGAVTKFVQFHPSYDYTDFVEGMRPIEKEDGQMGFERRDGVFKDFCREAIKNIENSQKSKQELKEEHSLEEKYNELVNKIENGEIQEVRLKTEGKSMEIVRVSDNNNIVLRTYGKTDGREYIVSFDRLAKLAKVFPTIKSLDAITNIYKSVTEVIGGCHSSSYWATLNEVYHQGISTKKDMPATVEKKTFVFIIDEINRGEASKIFGELFYAIDPGYRDKKDHLVQTQYQNLVPETDVFAKGFYVPENVYILATMNDIDRSVESMDFAMRRRFTWQEVTPDDTESMLDELSCVAEAKETMHRLNNAIAETDGLGAAYMIGPSYFLKLGENGGNFERLWKMNIEPLLREYLRGFRKSTEILEKFSKAYFDNSIKTDQPVLIDEN
jgi:hypothetical protein